MSASERAFEAFRAATGVDWPGLRDDVTAALTRAHAAWSSVELDDERFSAHLGERLCPATPESLEATEVEDLFLACACLHQVPRALALFDAEVLPRIAPVVRRYDPSPAFLDEVCQTLRQTLFLTPARIADYSGKGPLVAWLRSAAARTALNHLKPQQRRAHTEVDELEGLTFAAPEPELVILKGRHKAVFRAAFQAALATLPVRERTALKLNALDGVPLEKIGKMYGVDKSTVSRWISKSQDALLAQTRVQLAGALDLQSAEVESLMMALKSQLANSLVNLLVDP